MGGDAKTPGHKGQALELMDKVVVQQVCIELSCWIWFFQQQDPGGVAGGFPGA